MKRKGGRPKGDPAALRVMTIGVRVSLDEYAALRQKAAQMSMTPAQWLREAALSRRFPSPPVPPVNRERYAELARLAAFFFNDTATTEIYTLSLHDALPI